MPNTNTLTAETVTTAQIRALRDEAGVAGDLEQVEICDIALGKPDQYRTLDDARELCADAINAGQG